MPEHKILYRCTGIVRVLLGYSLHVPSTNSLYKFEGLVESEALLS